MDSHPRARPRLSPSRGRGHWEDEVCHPAFSVHDTMFSPHWFADEETVTQVSQMIWPCLHPARVLSVPIAIGPGPWWLLLSPDLQQEDLSPAKRLDQRPH